jgi:hypothetical protein
MELNKAAQAALPSRAVFCGRAKLLPIRVGCQRTSRNVQKRKCPGVRGIRGVQRTSLDVDGWVGGGESGIRTRGGLLAPTRFPGVRLKPLIHLSGACEFSAPGGPRAERRYRAAGGAAGAFISAIAVPISADTSVMLPGTIIVLFFCASCA